MLNQTGRLVQSNEAAELSVYLQRTALETGGGRGFFLSDLINTGYQIIRYDISDGNCIGSIKTCIKKGEEFLKVNELESFFLEHQDDLNRENISKIRTYISLINTAGFENIITAIIYNDEVIIHDGCKRACANYILSKTRKVVMPIFVIQTPAFNYD